MNATATRPHHLICNSLGLLLLALLASCASQTTRDSRLPFHVMVLAPAIVQDGEVLTPDIVSEGQSSQSAGWQTELALSFDSEALTGKLDRATNKRFCKVTVLPPDAQANTAIDRAIQVGADLILKTSLTYDPNIYTELNDRFWLNLPLFAIGGPFGWFVSDRNYYCNVQLEAELFDVLEAKANEVLDEQSRILQIDKASTEAALNFMDRADGVGSYLLSIVVPAGFVVPESEAVAGELSELIGEQLCQQLIQELQNRRTRVIRSPFVDFEPSRVRLSAEGDAVEGEMWLKRVGRAEDLGSLSYRIDDGEFIEASWGQESEQPGTGGQPDRKRYPFRIPVGAGVDRVQVRVEQLDSVGKQRTFTYAIAELRSE